MGLELVDYLRQYGIAQLTADFSIAAKRHNKYPNLVQFKYSQLDSPMTSKIVQQSRGIILDEADDWKVVCYPFNRFFNYGETHAAKIDWESARVFEKLVHRGI